MSDKAIQKARDFLINSELFTKGADTKWEMDLWAFEAYVLQETGGVLDQVRQDLYLGRYVLSPWAQALLALTIANASPGDSRAGELLSNLETTARPGPS